MKVIYPIILCLALGMTVSTHTQARSEKHTRISSSVSVHSRNWSMHYRDSYRDSYHGSYRDSYRHRGRNNYAPAYRPHYRPANVAYLPPVIIHSSSSYYSTPPAAAYIEQPAYVQTTPAYVKQAATTVATPRNDSQYWYYCEASRSYYPYVKQCPRGWMKVVPEPPH